MRQVAFIICMLGLVGYSQNQTASAPCKHSVENYDDYSGYCWCDPKSCQPSNYKSKELGK